MSGDVKIVIANPIESFCDQLSERIHSAGNMRIVGVAHDGNAALDMCLKLSPDVLVTGLLLPNLDGIGLIRKIHEYNLFPKIIVVSGFFNTDTAATLSQLGVGRFLPLPCDLDEIILFAESGSAPRALPSVPQTSFETEITDALLSCGIMPNLRGYRLLRSAVRMVLENRDNLQGITKILYPDLAKLHNTSAKSVERSIRNAIDSAWRACDTAKRRAHFGKYAPLLEAKPTNSAFISLLADFVESRVAEHRIAVPPRR